MPLPQCYNHEYVEYVDKCCVFVLFRLILVCYLVGGALPRPYSGVSKPSNKLQFVVTTQKKASKSEAFFII